MLPFLYSNILAKRIRVVFQFQHIFLHGLYRISHPSYCLTSLHAVNVLSPAASFLRFPIVPQSHIKKSCLMLTIQDYLLALAQGPSSVWHYTVTSGRANFTPGPLISYWKLNSLGKAGSRRWIFITASSLYNDFSFPTYCISIFTQEVQHTINKD